MGDSSLRMYLLLILGLVLSVGCEGTDWVRSVDGPSGPMLLPFHELTPSEGRDRGADGDVLWVQVDAAPYRELAQPALLLPRASSNVRVQLDEQWVSGSFERRPMRHTWNTPLLVGLPPEALTRADKIRIGLFAFRGDHRILEPFAIGEYTDLQPVHWWRHLFQVDIAFGASHVMGSFALLFLVLWLASGREGPYLIGSLSLGAFVLSNLNYHVSYQPWGHEAWQSLAHASLDWSGMLSALCLLDVRATALRKGWQLALLCWASLCTGLNLLLPGGSAVPYVEWVHAVTLVLFVAAAVRVFAGGGPPLEDRLTFGVGAALSAAMGASDLAAQARAIDALVWPRMSPYLGFVFAATSATWLLRRFGRTFAAARRNNDQLRQSVREREAELQVEHAELVRTKARLVRAEEREAMIRELHDGMGGQLVSALALSERVAGGTEVPEALRDALQELRTLVQRPVLLETAHLGSLLGAQRDRLERQLRRAEMSLLWEIDPAAELPTLEPNAQVHVARVVQECITNAIKHSGGSRVTLSVSAAEDATTLTVRDDGSGGCRSARGHGMSNIAERARAVGASCSYQSNENGTAVSLCWQLSTEPKRATRAERDWAMSSTPGGMSP